MKRIVIDEYMFYTVGSGLFGIMALMNTVSFAVSYKLSPNIYSMISRLAGILFSYLIFGFFIYLKNKLPPKNFKELSEADHLELLTGKKA